MRAGGRRYTGHELILLLIVSETRAPTSSAPRNSMNVATTMACGSVREREDTEVAKEFATSFAPMFHASWWAAVRYVGEEGGRTNKECKDHSQREDVVVLVERHGCGWGGFVPRVWRVLRLIERDRGTWSVYVYIPGRGMEV